MCHSAFGNFNFFTDNNILDYFLIFSGAAAVLTENRIDFVSRKKVEEGKLVYLDVDVVHDLDVAVYPDSGKIGIWGKDVNRIYHVDDDVDYYDGE